MDLGNRSVRLIIRKLSEARVRPPTVISVLSAWGAWPLLAAVGVLSITVLGVLEVPTTVTIFMVGLFAGAALRDLGIALKTVRFWPIQKELLDWQKIDEVSKLLDESKIRA